MANSGLTDEELATSQDESMNSNDDPNYDSNSDSDSNSGGTNSDDSSTVNRRLVLHQAPNVTVPATRASSPIQGTSAQDDFENIV